MKLVGYEDDEARSLLRRVVHKMFDSNEAYAHAAAMEQLQYDLNHSSRAMTYHYIGDYAETKRKTNMNMNLGLEILKPYFEVEKENNYVYTNPNLYNRKDEEHDNTPNH